MLLGWIITQHGKVEKADAFVTRYDQLGTDSKIDRHESIINAYENHGTPAVRDMKATYDERFKAQGERIDRLESIAHSNANSLQDLKTDVKTMLVELGNLEKSLDEHKRQMDPKGTTK